MNSVFQELYERHHQDVFNFLMYMVKQREVAEDLSQEVYIRVMKSYAGFENRSSEKTWLFSIARNVAIDHFRKQKGWKDKVIEAFTFATNTVKSDEPLPEEVALQSEEIQLMYRCLDHCSPDQRAVIILRYLQDFSITEAAQTLDWTESKVKTTQHRALKKLKELMIEKSGKEETIHEQA
ncbi:RNA polymerase sigma factor SigX [Mangrovibacillus cuniculi]|uniref:Sigma-70 family RNA polymerase sigma factor n=1 Tax=Mangrovibacillus cuniculi TaxID=2593652 RepID=A0A7S8CEA8_9BACI|nr:RNA polymerase sigma factor SigX [Mangrovibacillus cuniculi]QPC48393.1 sigma-70 family RNA polymerase sigma factor [Mangrovibacillus cuniculi]